MARCEDFPCCGHESGCCPDFDESGKQLNMVCTCGATLPVDSPSSICYGCRMQDVEDDLFNDYVNDYYEEGDNLVWSGDEEFAEEDFQQWE